jgi:hypothetical protein
MSKFSVPKRIIPFRLGYLGFIFVFALTSVSMLFATQARSAQVSVAWDAESAPVVGYYVYYGTSSGNYTNKLDASSSTTHTVPNLSDTSTYFLAATAYDSSHNESAFSQELVIYPMTVSAGTGGSITPNGSFFLSKGDSQTFTITPATGYSISNVSIDGVSAGAVSSYTLSNVTGGHTVTASFAPKTVSYAIAASAGANGVISPSGSVSVSSGGSQTFNISPNTNYIISSVTVDGTSVGAVSTYTFSGVTANHTIAASFAPKPVTTYNIVASAGANGAISPSGTVSVNSGGSQTFSITPTSNYKISGVTVDGKSVGAVSSYTFSNVTAGHTISATFVQKTYTITATAQSNGTMSPTGSVTVSSGAAQSFTITPNSGYQVADVTVDNTSVGAVTSYQFSNVTANHSITASFSQTNQPPVANAGPDQSVPENTPVTLNGSNSTDPQNTKLSYKWTQTGGPQVALSSATAANPTFTAPGVGTEGAALTFSLTVTNALGLQSSDNCIVNDTWVNQPPSANAGSALTVNEGATVTLDGSGSTDPDDGIASYEWKQTAGPTATLSAATSAQTTFVAPNVGTTGTSLTFQLTVTDKGGLKSTSNCIVNVTWVDSPPVANAGSDQSVYGGNTVALDGSGSYDPDDGIKTYAWKQTSGTPVTLTNSAAAQPSFTAPQPSTSGTTLTFALTVTDNAGLQSTATCNVYVKQAGGPDLTGAWSSVYYSKFKMLNASFTARNSGNQNAGAFSIRCYLSDDGKTLGKLVATGSLRYLNAAQSKTLSFYYFSYGLAGKYLIGVVDPANTVAESNEENNSIQAVIP